MKDIIKEAIGTTLIYFKPKKASRLSEMGMTIDVDLDLEERLMRYSILKKAEKTKNYEVLAEYHQNYWKNKGASFFENTQSKFVEDFLPNCSFLFDYLEDELKKSTVNYDKLVEIGTGSGEVLEYLASKLTKVSDFIGLDLSKEQIDLNIKKYSQNTSMFFEAEDGLEWILENGSDNMVIVTSKGVLEYFTQKRLSKFFGTLSGFENIVIAAIEPIAYEHDFEKNSDSIPYGLERSFSHNYKKMLTQAGFSLWHYSLKDSKAYKHKLSFIGASK